MAGDVTMAVCPDKRPLCAMQIVRILQLRGIYPECAKRVEWAPLRMTKERRSYSPWARRTSGQVIKHEHSATDSGFSSQSL